MFIQAIPARDPDDVRRYSRIFRVVYEVAGRIYFQFVGTCRDVIAFS